MKTMKPAAEFDSVNIIGRTLQVKAGQEGAFLMAYQGRDLTLADNLTVTGVSSAPSAGGTLTLKFRSDKGIADIGTAEFFNVVTDEDPVNLPGAALA